MSVRCPVWVIDWIGSGLENPRGPLNRSATGPMISGTDAILDATGSYGGYRASSVSLSPPPTADWAGRQSAQSRVFVFNVDTDANQESGSHSSSSLIVSEAKRLPPLYYRCTADSLPGGRYATTADC
eukprot:GHVU01154540.1.p1 GENE.GHVU01154540.1~~GHVU01154540.1.p1  ORF type:complete len:127 (+),score=21.38 GHVU01154540.1:202-582(+)